MPQIVLEEKLKKIRREAEEREARRLADALGVPYLDLAAAPIQIDALRLLPQAEAVAARAVVFSHHGRLAGLAARNPSSPAVTAIVERLTKQGIAVKTFLVSETGLAHALSYYRYVPAPTAAITGEVDIAAGRLAELLHTLGTIPAVADAVKKFDFKKTPTGQLLELFLAGALANRTSDIHFEAEEGGVRVRYRVDGKLYDAAPLTHDVYKFIVSRIKLLSNLKLNVTETPQDGRFTVESGERNVELRVSIIPSQFGETIVMRVLDPASLKTKLTDLGLREDDLAIIERELKKPNGMLLNTGPTGSGKTTTLYAFLIHRRTPEIKIITIEDPIEYRIEGIEQTQVDPSQRYDFASGLRSIMRQDPDVILVGEIRDKETAEIGIQAALTGHLVFSTVHANSATGAIPRLVDLGVKPQSIGPALNLVIAQRLVRVLCEKCKARAPLDAALQEKLARFLNRLPKRVDRAPYRAIAIFAPKGCAACNNLGYRGRLAIFELLEVSDDLKAMIPQVADEISMKKVAASQGMVTMQEDGVLKVIQGITTFEEVEEVTGPLGISINE